MHIIRNTEFNKHKTLLKKHTFQFDVTKEYDVQVVLNPGTGVEIRSEKIGLNLSYDPDYKDVVLDPEDYYPALGARKLKAENMPGSCKKAWSTSTWRRFKKHWMGIRNFSEN